jgi:5-methylthioribose kinase
MNRVAAKILGVVIEEMTVHQILMKHLINLKRNLPHLAVDLGAVLVVVKVCYLWR